MSKKLFSTFVLLLGAIKSATDKKWSNIICKGYKFIHFDASSIVLKVRS